MGRPLRKDVNGVDVIGPYAAGTENAGIKIEFYDTELRTDGVIEKQRGAKTYVVTRQNDWDSQNNSDNKITCVLKNGAPSAAGEMRMFGYNPTNSGEEVNIAKLTKRVATDFSGNRYTWYLENDSTNDYIVLTAI